MPSKKAAGQFGGSGWLALGLLEEIGGSPAGQAQPLPFVVALFRWPSPVAAVPVWSGNSMVFGLLSLGVRVSEVRLQESQSGVSR